MTRASRILVAIPATRPSLRCAEIFLPCCLCPIIRKTATQCHVDRASGESDGLRNINRQRCARNDVTDAVLRHCCLPSLRRSPAAAIGCGDMNVFALCVSGRLNGVAPSSTRHAIIGLTASACSSRIPDCMRVSVRHHRSSQLCTLRTHLLLDSNPQRRTERHFWTD